MSKSYLLNNHIVFSPEKMQLAARDNDQMVITLNKPVSHCLELLIERRFSLVSHHEFYPYVWGDEGSSVSVAMLYQCIALLRKALKTFKPIGEKMIKTTPKKGFSLDIDVIVEEINDEFITLPHTHSLPLNHPIGEKEAFSGISPPLSPMKTAAVPKWRIQRIFPAGIIVLLGLMVFQLKQWGYPSSMGYLARYTEKTTIVGCQVFSDHVVQNVGRLKESMQRSQIDCAKTPYVYVTGYQHSHQISLLSCEQPLEDLKTAACFVNNIFRSSEK